MKFIALVNEMSRKLGHGHALTEEQIAALPDDLQTLQAVWTAVGRRRNAEGAFPPGLAGWDVVDDSTGKRRFILQHVTGSGRLTISVCQEPSGAWLDFVFATGQSGRVGDPVAHVTFVVEDDHDLGHLAPDTRAWHAHILTNEVDRSLLPSDRLDRLGELVHLTSGNILYPLGQAIIADRDGELRPYYCELNARSFEDRAEQCLAEARYWRVMARPEPVSGDRRPDTSGWNDDVQPDIEEE